MGLVLLKVEILSVGSSEVNYIFEKQLLPAFINKLGRWLRY